MNYKLNFDSLGLGISKAINGLKDTFKNVNKVNEELKKQKTFVKDVEKASATLTTSFSKIHPLAGKTAKFFKNLSGGMKGLKKDAAILGHAIKANFTSIILPIIAVTSAIVVLRRMFKLNIGGMATYWYKFVSKLRIVWYKFVRAFDKLLRENSDVFKEVFEVMYNLVMPIIGALNKLVEWFNSLPKPIRKIIVVLGVLAGVIATVTAAIVAATLAYIALDVATGGLLWSFGLIVTAIVGIGAAIYMLVKYWDDVVDRAKEFLNTLTKIATFIPSFMIPGLNLNTKVSPVSSGNTSSSQIINNNQQIQLHSATPFSLNEGKPVANLLARYLDGGS